MAAPEPVLGDSIRGSGWQPGDFSRIQRPAAPSSGGGASESEVLRGRSGRRTTWDDVTPADVLPLSGTSAALIEHREAVQLRELARSALRGALHAEARGGVPDADVRRMLRRACDAARACNAHVEQVLILLKEAWRELPGARHGTHGEAQARLARMVTLCIKEYYAP